MKLTRRKRIAFELLGPPLIGTMLIFSYVLIRIVWSAIETGELPKMGKGTEIFSILGYTLLAGYIFGAIPNLIYTSVMESKFEGGMNPKSWRAVSLAAGLLGSLSGIMYVAFLKTFKFKWGFETFAVPAGLGLTVGFFMGLLIRRWSKEPAPTGENRP